MKVLYDHQVFTLQHYGGISRYFTELMRQFHEQGMPRYELSLVYSDNIHLGQASFRANPRLLSSSYLPWKKRIREILNLRKSVNAIKRGDFDIFHPTYYQPYFLRYIDKKPFVVTVHDMIHELFPDCFGKDPTAGHKKRLIQRASGIIAVSENTRKDLMEIYGVDEGRIEVIHHGHSFHPTGGVRSDLDVPERYILFVGTRWRYKNFLCFVDSVAPLLRNDSGLYVVCAGGKPFDSEEMARIRGLDCITRFIHYPVNDDLIISLYRHARAFVFPSLYEGFGIPVLESFGCGCPVIVSNTSSLPEVAGDAAVYVNPEDRDSITRAMEKVIYHDDLRNDLIRKGYEQAKRFSWKDTAEKTRLLYERLMYKDCLNTSSTFLQESS